MISKSLIQFYVDGRDCVPSLLFDQRPKISASFMVQQQTFTTLQQATTDPRLHQRLLDIPGQVWVSVLWGHCSFLLGPGMHEILFVPSKSLFPQSYVSSVVGLR